MTGGNAMQHIRLDDSGVIKEVEGNGFHFVCKSGSTSREVGIW